MKAIPLNELKRNMLNTPEAVQAYEDADRELAIIELLYHLREEAGLSKSDVAKRMGVAPSAISRLEGNPMGASIKTLNRYAAACNARLDISAVY